MAKKTTIVPIGPYHPLQEEPEFFKLYVEGEKVVGLDVELGYNHRGIEKLSESKDYEETIFLVERVCGICSTSHPMACVQAIEEAGEIEVPERALFIRSLIGELERIHSHLLWLGLAGHFLGFNTVWMWAWRYREEVLTVMRWLGKAPPVQWQVHQPAQSLRPSCATGLAIKLFVWIGVVRASCSLARAANALVYAV